MKKTLVCCSLFFVLLLSFMTGTSFGDAEAPLPVPVFTDVTVRGNVSYDSATGLYTYSYSIGNPATNTGVIQDVWLDIILPKFGEKLSSDGLVLTYKNKQRDFTEEVARQLDPYPMVPVGLAGPEGWVPSIGARGAAHFSPRSFDLQMKPGEEKSGYQIISRGLPGIREATIEPYWIFVNTEGAISAEESANADRISESLEVHKTTIGPTAPTTRNFVWEQADINIPDYITKSVALGWLNDAALADALREKIVQARDLFNSDPSQAKVRLTEFMALIDQATASQISPEAKGLLYFNALDLKNRLPDTIPEPVSILNLTPEKSEFPIGTMYTLTATYTLEQGSEVSPLSNEMIELRILAGPNEGMSIDSQMTDETGKAVFTYTSTLVGTDHLVALHGQTPAKKDTVKGVQVAFNDPDAGLFSGMPASQASLIDAMPGYLVLAQNDYSDLIPEYMTASGVVEVNWTAGPDLTIPLFIPPHLTTQGGNPMFISDETKNIGELPSVPSVTRYYISPKSDAQCYNIYRSTQPDGILSEDSLIAPCHVTTYATYLDNQGLITDETYYYRVSKVANSVETCLSNTASATPTPR